jgi:hypothetical protein
MKQKAILMKVAGQNPNKQNLFAILDIEGRTEYQIWSTIAIIEKQYDLIK